MSETSKTAIQVPSYNYNPRVQIDMSSVCEQVAALCVCSVISDPLQPLGLKTARLLCPLNFSKQEDSSELPYPPPGELPHPGIKPVILHLLKCRWILYHYQHLMLFYLPCKTWNVVKPRAWLARHLPGVSRLLPRLICGATSLASEQAVRALPVRAVSGQVRSKVRGLLCFVSEA